LISDFRFQIYEVRDLCSLAAQTVVVKGGFEISGIENLKSVRASAENICVLPLSLRTSSFVGRPPPTFFPQLDSFTARF
jgi:hypothetical protein